MSTSTESLDNLCEMLAAQKNVLRQKDLLVISERMSQHAKQLGFSKQAIVTTQVSNQAIINSLAHYNKSKKGYNAHGK